MKSQFKIANKTSEVFYEIRHGKNLVSQWNCSKTGIREYKKFLALLDFKEPLKLVRIKTTKEELIVP